MRRAHALVSESKRIDSYHQREIYSKKRRVEPSSKPQPRFPTNRNETMVWKRESCSIVSAVEKDGIRLYYPLVEVEEEKNNNNKK
jgi:hypothetical protein